jgi:hypothetical protein
VGIKCEDQALGFHFPCLLVYCLDDLFVAKMYPIESANGYYRAFRRKQIDVVMYFQTPIFV